ESQRDQALRRMARRDADVVVAVGFSFATPLEAIAEEFPDTRFVIIDAVVEEPTVPSVAIEEHEGSLPVGMAAAMASATGKVGFVGGMDIPLIRNFAHGYEQGVHHVDPDAEVFVNMTGTTPAAWNDPAKGAELAQSQFDRGADVVYAAAGGTGLGVLQAAADSGKLSIGVDSNQNYLHPGSVLTSMPKRADGAGATAFKDATGGDRLRQAVDRRRQQPELPAPGQRADLHAQAGRRRGVQRVQGRDGGRPAGRRAEPRPRRGRRRLRARRVQSRADHPGDGSRAR